MRQVIFHKLDTHKLLVNYFCITQINQNRPDMQDTSQQPELIFGLVSPIGVNLDDLQDALSDSLRAVYYCPNIIHVSKLVEKYNNSNENTVNKDDFSEKISMVNNFCAQKKDKSATIPISISEICRIRGDMKSQGSTAFIIRQLKRTEEIAKLRHVYGKNFIQISALSDKDSRINYLANRIRRGKNIDQSTALKQAEHLIEIDEKDTHPFGQEVEKIFHLADIFIDCKDRTTINNQVTRIINAIFGENASSPTKDEFGSFMAYAASMRSVDTTRQVGSAILNNFGDIISLGCNEVPKAGGGNYWIGDNNISRDIDIGVQQNDIEQTFIGLEFANKLKETGVISDEIDLDNEEIKSKIIDAIEKSSISNITEYGRMTHAEMTSLCDAARTGNSVRNATMYVTTFPCHNCMKHIVASGICRVVFIEPYPKSKALDLHNDSVSFEKHTTNKVYLSHFFGISPRIYRDIFSKKSRKINGEIQKWYYKAPFPMIEIHEFYYLDRESIVISDFFSKSE